jgi:hypothetical protein
MEYFGGVEITITLYNGKTFGTTTRASKLALKICSQSPILCGFQPVSKVPKNG